MVACAEGGRVEKGGTREVVEGAGTTPEGLDAALAEVRACVEKTTVQIVQEGGVHDMVFSFGRNRFIGFRALRDAIDHQVAAEGRRGGVFSDLRVATAKALGVHARDFSRKL